MARKAAKNRRQKKDAVRTASDHLEPTKERMRKGEFVPLRQGALYDKTAWPPDRAFNAGKISERQLNAAMLFAITAERAQLCPSPRSCLDWSVRGGRVSGYDTRHIDAVRTMRRLYVKLGSFRYDILYKICVIWKPTGQMRDKEKRFRSFVEGLELAADYWHIR